MRNILKTLVYETILYKMSPSQLNSGKQHEQPEIARYNGQQ